MHSHTKGNVHQENGHISSVGSVLKTETETAFFPKTDQNPGILHPGQGSHKLKPMFGH